MEPSEAPQAAFDVNNAHPHRSADNAHQQRREGVAMDNAHPGAWGKGPDAEFMPAEQGAGEDPGDPDTSLPESIDPVSDVQDCIGRRHAKLPAEFAGLPGVLAGVDHAMLGATPLQLGENGHQLDQLSLGSVGNVDHATLSKGSQPARLVPDRGMVLYRSEDCKRSGDTVCPSQRKSSDRQVT
jgi:hypothetical protein